MRPADHQLRKLIIIRQLFPENNVFIARGERNELVTVAAIVFYNKLQIGQRTLRQSNMRRGSCVPLSAAVAA